MYDGDALVKVENDSFDGGTASWLANRVRIERGGCWSSKFMLGRGYFTCAGNSRLGKHRKRFKEQP